MRYAPVNNIKCQVCDKAPAVAYHGDAPMCPNCWFDRERKVKGNSIPTDRPHFWSKQ